MHANRIPADFVPFSLPKDIHRRKFKHSFSKRRKRLFNKLFLEVEWPAVCSTEVGKSVSYPTRAVLLL